MSYINIKFCSEDSNPIPALIQALGEFLINTTHKYMVNREGLKTFQNEINELIPKYLKTNKRVKVDLLDFPENSEPWKNARKKRKINLTLIES